MYYESDHQYADRPSMRKFVKQTPFMGKLYLKNKFKKNACIPKSSVRACTKFQAD